MTGTSNQKSCAARGWRAAAFGGVGFAVLYMVIGGAGLIGAVIAGLVVFAAIGFAVSRFLCPEAQDQGEAAAAPKPAAQAASAPAPEAPAPAAVPEAPAPDPVAEVPVQAPEPEPVAAAKPAEAPAPAPRSSADAVVKPSAVLAGEQELASRKGSWRYEGKAAD
ncbi:MAG: hypothetical protein AB3N15_00295 [Paracoccaceae bacterium]